MEKKETTPRRAARRSYEERNKDKRKQTSGNFGTMIPRDLYEEINEFLAKKQIYIEESGAITFVLKGDLEFSAEV